MADDCHLALGIMRRQLSPKTNDAISEDFAFFGYRCPIVVDAAE